MRILVTGAAGFIGFHLGGRLLPEGRQVVGIDGLNGGAWTWCRSNSWTFTGSPM